MRRIGHGEADHAPSRFVSGAEELLYSAYERSGVERSDRD